MILRMAKGTPPPPTVRVVSSFGNEIYTGRIARGDIVAVRETPGVLSLKAGKVVTLPSPLETTDETDGAEAIDESDEAVPDRALAFPDPAAIGEDGRGVVVGICDWGIDFTHANFRNADGTTRLHSLWDQRGHGDPLAPAPYDYGRLLTRDAINAALGRTDPCAALGYHPAGGDPSEQRLARHARRRHPRRQPARARAPRSVWRRDRTSCSSTWRRRNLSELGNLGDSVGLLEGLDFVRRQAAGRPVRAAPERGQDRRAASRRHAARARGGLDAGGARHRAGAERRQLRRQPRCTRTRASAPIRNTRSTG